MSKFFGSPLRRLSLSEQMLLFKHVSVLLSANIPLLEALLFTAEQTTKPRSRDFLQHLQKEVERGQTLAAACARGPWSVRNEIVCLINVGEKSGTLDQSLRSLVVILKKQFTLRRKIVGALMYPACVGLATMGITFLLTFVIFPKLIPIFESFSRPLPFSTRLLITIGNFSHQHWRAIVIGAVLLPSTLALSRQHQRARKAVDTIILRLPLFGHLVQTHELARWLRTSGTLLENNVDIIESMELVSKTMSNAVYIQALRQVTQDLVQGQRLSESLKKNKKLWPPNIVGLVAIGEASGHLSANLIYLAEMFEDDLDQIADTLSAALEPALMVLMGCIVGFLAIAIVTPIYGLTTALHA